jgi:hypothetical protein
MELNDIDQFFTREKWAPSISGSGVVVSSASQTSEDSHQSSPRKNYRKENSHQMRLREE